MSGAEVTDLCKAFEELAEGPSDDIKRVVGKLNEGIDGTLRGWIALDHVQGHARIYGQLREGECGGNTRGGGDGPFSLFC